MHRRYTRQKHIIKLALFGLVLINLLMACAILVPSNTVNDDSLEIHNSEVQDDNTPRISTAEKIAQADQEVRSFWVALLPFWDE